ncbi:hypothetical protein F959_01607 [Acinetobacter venetianus RAG-1 = CIP 110063]|uniref:Uncharacterized protein n=1 Tax=Acinetobacter venetianus (strain ATCC 31012 / DSM 23050 / BCRC 14357 / CCUG 45561 / CIP 110063 / KCTC 2702 / LMG 19082 / RAG-1) TaxID=1191460 RepID=N8ZUP2_ACIVR|nr:hypothetical protein [Acinetobacter venetianus]ENV37484.1 hypothetical protein F959_01607 [Acinetobacter venetianus RAG-1 = CIP 110063]
MTKYIEREAFEAWFKTTGMYEALIEYIATHQPNLKSAFIKSGKSYRNTMVNTAWSSWQAAKAHEAKNHKDCAVFKETEFALLPKTITPEIEEILGMPCFKFIKAAQIYRLHGFDIQPKAEKEQAFFIFKILHLALLHGDKCFDVFEAETKEMVIAARDKNHE